MDQDEFKNVMREAWCELVRLPACGLAISDTVHKFRLDFIGICDPQSKPDPVDARRHHNHRMIWSSHSKSALYLLCRLFRPLFSQRVLRSCQQWEDWAFKTLLTELGFLVLLESVVQHAFLEMVPGSGQTSCHGCTHSF